MGRPVEVTSWSGPVSRDFESHQMILPGFQWIFVVVTRGTRLVQLPLTRDLHSTHGGGRVLLN
jgi:hypothetical protein